MCVLTYKLKQLLQQRTDERAMQVLMNKYPEAADVWRYQLAPYLLPSVEECKALYARVIMDVRGIVNHYITQGCVHLLFSNRNRTWSSKFVQRFSQS